MAVLLVIVCIAFIRVFDALSVEETSWKSPGGTLFAPGRLLPYGTGKHAVVYALSWQRWRRCQAILGLLVLLCSTRITTGRRGHRD